MQGFKDFLARGNLIELAVAFIMGTVFARVVEAFTKIVLDVLGLIVQVEGLSDIAVRGVNVGGFLTALITFVLTAAVLYFLVVMPLHRLLERRVQGEEPGPVAPTEVELLAELDVDRLEALAHRRRDRAFEAYFGVLQRVEQRLGQQGAAFGQGRFAGIVGFPLHGTLSGGKDIDDGLSDFGPNAVAGD